MTTGRHVPEWERSEWVDGEDGSEKLCCFWFKWKENGQSKRSWGEIGLGDGVQR